MRLKEEKKRKKLEEKKVKEKMKMMKLQMKKMKKEEELLNKNKEKEKPKPVKGAQAILVEEEGENEENNEEIEEEIDEKFDVNDQRLYRVYDSFFTIGESNYESGNLNKNSEPFIPIVTEEKLQEYKGMNRLIKENDKLLEQKIIGNLSNLTK